MQQLTPDGEREVQNLAQRYGVSVDAVKAMLAAVSAGGGTMAQFYIQELGGGGQWMQGGMTMVGDMFNSRLQSTVSGLCGELSTLLASRQVFVPLPQNQGQNQGGGWMSSGNSWWPSDLGHPSSSGGQNDARYAYFPNPRRLAIERNGHVTVYDTLDHQIGGVQQQQGGSYGSLSFSSQFGTFTVDSLPLANHPINPPPQAPQQQPAPPPYSPPMSQSAPQQAGNIGGPHSREDVLATLERLGQLHGKGILSDDEFQSKKAELLARL
jgi:hypothetical protein